MKSVVNDQDIMEHFGLYFYDGKRIRTTLLKEIIERVMEITLCFKSLRGWKFYSTSICFFYDCDSPRWSVKLIDF